MSPFIVKKPLKIIVSFTALREMVIFRKGGNCALTYNELFAIFFKTNKTFKNGSKGKAELFTWLPPLLRSEVLLLCTWL